MYHVSCGSIAVRLCQAEKTCLVCVLQEDTWHHQKHTAWQFQYLSVSLKDPWPDDQHPDWQTQHLCVVQQDTWPDTSIQTAGLTHGTPPLASRIGDNLSAVRLLCELCHKKTSCHAGRCYADSGVLGVIEVVLGFAVGATMPKDILRRMGTDMVAARKVCVLTSLPRLDDLF